MVTVERVPKHPPLMPRPTTARILKTLRNAHENADGGDHQNDPAVKHRQISRRKGTIGLHEWGLIESINSGLDGVQVSARERLSKQFQNDLPADARRLVVA
jgi:hypothetical protein